MIRAGPYTSLWIGVSFWALVTIGVVGGTVWELNQNYLFAYFSQPAEAAIAQKFMQVSQGKHGKVYTPCLVYQYQVGATVFHCQSTVQNNTYSTVAEGGEMPILYLTGNPGDNRIELPSEIRSVCVITWIAITASLLIGIGGAFSINYYVKRNRLNRWLLASGMSCRGTVSSVDFNLVGKAQTRCYFLNFDFRDNQGQTISGKTWYLKPGTETDWREGSTLPVYFDPSNSKSFTVDLSSGLPGR
jgi:hypothetical protein